MLFLIFLTLKCTAGKKRLLTDLLYYSFVV